jgi:D-ribose pyranose/furanose isomerase RbsD
MLVVVVLVLMVQHLVLENNHLEDLVAGEEVDGVKVMIHILLQKMEQQTLEVEVEALEHGVLQVLLRP